MIGTSDAGGMLEEPSSGRGCTSRVLKLPPDANRSSPFPRPPGASDTTPAMWHGVVAFARREPRHGLVSQILTWSPRHPRALLGLPHGAVPSECPAQDCKGYFGYGEAQALAFDGVVVAFVWGPKILRQLRGGIGIGRRVDDAGGSSAIQARASGARRRRCSTVEGKFPACLSCSGRRRTSPTLTWRLLQALRLARAPARPGARLEAALRHTDTRMGGRRALAYALVAQVPNTEQEAPCASAAPVRSAERKVAGVSWDGGSRSPGVRTTNRTDIFDGFVRRDVCSGDRDLPVRWPTAQAPPQPASAPASLPFPHERLHLRSSVQTTLLATGADAPAAPPSADVLADELQVLAWRLGQVGELRHSPRSSVQPRQLGQLGGGVVKHGLVVGEVVEHGAVGAAVARADLDAVEPESTSSLVTASAVSVFRRAA